MKLFAILSALIISVIGASSYAYANKGHHNPEKITAKLTEKLNLDANQAAALRDYLEAKQQLRAERKAERQARHEAGTAKKSELMTLLNSDSAVSVQEVTEVIDKKRQAMRERQQPVLEKFLVFRNGLSPQQRQDAKKVMRRLLKGVIGRVKHGRRAH